MYQIKNILVAFLTMLLFAGCATQTAEVVEFSGYLGDYSGLKKTKDELGNEVLRWKSSELKPGKYKKIMLDEVVFYPPPKETPQLSRKAIDEIRDYANEALRREVSKVAPIASQPGPDVLRMRMALTGVSTSAEGLAAYEYIPIAAIYAGVTTMTGARDREAFILAETELLDARTGERLFIEVFKKKAKKLLKDDKQQVTLDTVRELIDNGAVQSRKFFENLNLK